jgi:hypothetical protein
MTDTMAPTRLTLPEGVTSYAAMLILPSRSRGWVTRRMLRALPYLEYAVHRAGTGDVVACEAGYLPEHDALTLVAFLAP